MIIHMSQDVLCFIVAVTGMVLEQQHQVIASIYFYGAEGILWILIFHNQLYILINFLYLTLWNLSSNLGDFFPCVYKYF